MTLRYVDGTSGNNSWDGLSPVFTSGTNGPKLTLNGAEDSPVAAGDIVHVRPGVYRELLTVDVAGSSGNPIEYRGDYAGVIWSSTKGQIVRISGSDNDQTITRANCVNMVNARSFRSFTGFVFESISQSHINLQASSSNLAVNNCLFKLGSTSAASIIINGTGGAHSIKNCYFHCQGPGIQFTHTATVDNTASVVENCIFIGGGSSINVRVDRVGGITIRNSLFLSGENSIRVQTALTVGQTVTVNNSIITNANSALTATTVGELVENFNCVYGNVTARTSVNTGANSVAYPPLFDVRWFFEMLYNAVGPNSATAIVSPFDLGSASQLINLAGTSPPTLDLRGTAVQGSQREFGPLEYDSTIKKSASASAGGIAPSPIGSSVVRKLTKGG